MHNTIMKAIHPKVEAELHSTEELISTLENFIAEHENTEDESLMIKVLTSRNKLKRLEEELPHLQEQTTTAHAEVKEIVVVKQEADAAILLKEALLPSIKVIGELVANLKSGEIVIPYFHGSAVHYNMQHFYYDFEKGLESQVIKANAQIEKNESNRKLYSKLRGVL